MMLGSFRALRAISDQFTEGFGCACINKNGCHTILKLGISSKNKIKKVHCNKWLRLVIITNTQFQVYYGLCLYDQ